MPTKTSTKRSRTRFADSLAQGRAQAEPELADVLVLQRISSELIPEHRTEALYGKIVDAAVAIMRSDFASMQMLFPERGRGGELRLLGFRGFNPQAARFWEWVRADSKSTCGIALRTAQRVVAPDIASCDFMADSEDQQIYLQTGIRACQTTPLISRAGNVVGMISTHWRTPHQPSEKDFRLFDILARQAADLIERCRREEQLQLSEDRYRKLTDTLDAEVRARTLELEKRNADVLRQAEQMRELSRHLLDAQDQERRKVARELHDSAGQTLAFITMTLDQLREASKDSPETARLARQTEESVRELHREIRTASYLLHPPLLDESGLSSALRWYIDGLRARSGLQITLTVSDDFQRLPPELEILLFRVVQECLVNIHKHSGSNTASIRLTQDKQNVVIVTQDEGKGIPREKLSEVQSIGSGVGIRGMRERVQQFNGSLVLESDCSGTRVLATVPLPKNANRQTRTVSKILSVNRRAS